MSVSRTTRTRRTHLIVDEVENLPLVQFGIAFLDLSDGEVENTLTNCLIDKPGKITFLSTVAGKEDAYRTVRLIRNGEAPSSHDNSSVYKRLNVYVPILFLGDQRVNPSTVLTERHMNSTNCCTGFVPLTRVAREYSQTALGVDTEMILALSRTAS